MRTLNFESSRLHDNFWEDQYGAARKGRLALYGELSALPTVFDGASRKGCAVSLLIAFLLLTGCDSPDTLGGAWPKASQTHTNK